MWKALSVIAAVLAAGAAFLSYLNKGDVEQERDLLSTSANNLKEINARFNEIKSGQEAFIAKNTKMEERRDKALEEQAATKQKLDDKIQEVEDTEARIKELEAKFASIPSWVTILGMALMLASPAIFNACTDSALVTSSA